MATSTLGSGTLVLAGTTSGTTTVTATAVAGTTTLTLPAATDTLVGKATTDTLTNKTLTGAVMNGTVGATTPATGAFTTLSATGTGTLRDIITTTGALIQGTSIFRVESTAAALPAGTLAGLGLEMYASSGTQKLSVYNRTTNLAGPLDFLGSTFNFNAILDISNASAGQIKFPATQNASANAKTLDDYEEGAWIPTQGAGLTVVGAFSSAGHFTKVGRQVTIQGYVAGATTVAAAANGLICSGLPFPCMNVTGSHFIGGASNGNLTALINVWVNQASSSMYAVTAMSATAGIYFTASYFTT